MEVAGTYLRSNVPALADIYLELAHKGTVAAQSWSAATAAVDVMPVDAARLRSAVADLCRPAILVVENQAADGCFVRAVAAVFGFTRVTQALATDMGWLEICHGGGSDLVQVATTAAGRFRELTRVVALLDSDRLVPRGPAPGDDKQRRLHSAGKILVHVLRLREAENYVPNAVLGRVPRRHARAVAARLHCLKQLSPTQRGHFDMKYGLGAAFDGATVAGPQHALYQAVNPRILRGLQDGFGKDLLSRLERVSLEGGVSEQDFASLGPGVVAELRSLLTMLDSVI
jgi:hypothetical protein